MDKVVEKFLKYVSFDTKSDASSEKSPSTDGQLVLANVLKEELISLGLKDVILDEYGYVVATLLSNVENDNGKTLGLLAHMDTSPDAEGKDVKAKIVKNYDGNDIILNGNLNTVLSPKDFPDLKNYIGNDLITTDGTTLLGADDKAGIAEIMAAIEFLTLHPEIKHGKIKICFTPDEEVSRGTEHINLETFDVDYAYTIDGGSIGGMEYENFNAAFAKVTIEGKSVHPGSAKNKMINSVLVANEFINKLPIEETPQNTENYEGFYHITSIKGACENTILEVIIRDFDMDNFEKRKVFLKGIIDEINFKMGEELIKIEIRDQYFNMKEKIEPVMFLIDNLKEAMIECDVVPKIHPIRGGTDGASLSFMGIPTPNVFTGGENFHGRFEFISIQSMKKAVEVIISLVQKFVN